jgi:hypothetical protein
MGKWDFLPRGAAVLEVEVRIEWMGRRKNGSMAVASGASLGSLFLFFHGGNRGSLRSRVELRGVPEGWEWGRRENICLE